MSRYPAAAAAALLALVLTGCSVPPESTKAARAGAAEPSTSTEGANPTQEPSRPAASSERAAIGRPASLAGDGRPRPSLLTIPTIGVRALRVLPYRGSPDDLPGTRIQDTGVAASPHGPRGGVGPGGIGNHIVTAHRTSSTRAFDDLPRLRVGDKVHVVAARTRYVYRVVGTRTTSFRSPRSLARQSADVPGHPGRRPTRAMITLSTCATPEDHARGNYWADRFGNPEHRIDKIGVLVAVRPA
jgi:sortase A